MSTSSTERMRAMRARRAAAIEAASESELALRPADHLLSPAVETTLAALDLDGQDAAVAALARFYARTIDRAKDPAWAARWVMPLLGDTLAALGATPASRAKIKPARPTQVSRRNWLDEMRAARPRV